MDECRICGLPFSARSFGGPGICPTCDCGIQPVDTQRLAITQLRTELSELAGAYAAAVEAQANANREIERLRAALLAVIAASDKPPCVHADIAREALQESAKP